MAKKERIIATFLVSMGVFSSSLALKYVSSLTEAQKDSLHTMMEKTSGTSVLCDTGDPASIYNDDTSTSN